MMAPQTSFHSCHPLRLAPTTKLLLSSSAKNSWLRSLRALELMVTSSLHASASFIIHLHRSPFMVHVLLLSSFRSQTNDVVAFPPNHLASLWREIPSPRFPPDRKLAGKDLPPSIALMNSDSLKPMMGPCSTT